MRKYINPEFKHFLHGADYNPEQWIDDKAIWDEDMRLMKLANCNEMSVGIFSWAKLEPQEGVFDFSWLDEVLDRIHKAGGKVFLATPSGARPRWLAEKYPEVLRVAKNGVRNRFGERHNHCLTSPIYREKVRIIDLKLAERYGNHPAVIGWHISNEYGGECFCPLCVDAYRKWLIKKYDNDIDKLNKQWWNTFWSHTYTSFDQVEPPMLTGENYALDWNRFVSDQTANFIRGEVHAIREYSDLPTTTNFMQFYPQLNYSVLEKEIDFVSWDSYPEWHCQDGKHDNVSVAKINAATHDVFRSMKNKPFALMESTPSNTNWQGYAKLKRPGMHKLSCMQAVAHGSDTVQYFQWRKSRGNTEKFHGAVVDHLGTEHNRVFNEVKEVGKTLIDIEEVLGTMPKVEVALVMDVENEWALKDCWGYQLKDKKYFDTCLSFYGDLWERGLNVDIIDTTRDFSKYKLVIAPMLYSVSEKTISKITEFVQNGGVFVSGYMLGSVNENDLCYLGGFPANNLKEVFGVWAEEIDTLFPSERNAIIKDGVMHEVLDYCERLHARGNAQVIGVYRNDFYANEPAVIKNKFGKGTTYYIGARDTGSLKHDIISNILSDLEIDGEIKNLPYGVTCHSREDGENLYLFVENYNDIPVTVDIGAKKLNLETKIEESGNIELQPYGVRIYKKIN